MASARIGQGIDLIKLAQTTSKALYEPDQFAAVIKRMGGSVVGLIFGTGRIVIVGSKTYEELNVAYFELEQLIKKYELP